MTDRQSEEAVKNAGASGTRSAAGTEAEHFLATYESAGITEREGNVPIWLWIVVVSLLLWGLYYLVTYWNGPATPP